MENVLGEGFTGALILPDQGLGDDDLDCHVDELVGAVGVAWDAGLGVKGEFLGDEEAVAVFALDLGGVFEEFVVGF